MYDLLSCENLLPGRVFMHLGEPPSSVYCTSPISKPSFHRQPQALSVRVRDTEGQQPCLKLWPCSCVASTLP